MTLAKGAVQLPPAHLSVRVPWNDTDWTGRVCRSPAANQACTVLKNVKERKNADQEEDDRGKQWTDLPQSRVPPCVYERGGFMRPSAFTMDRDHAYARWSQAHQHFASTHYLMPPYSFEATPYRWVLRGELQRYTRLWGIEYDGSLERRADELIGWGEPTDWVQDRRNQLALLDSFFSAVSPRRSLLLIYAKDVPLVEDRTPGMRILVGAARVARDVPSATEWSYDRNPDPGALLRSVLWERPVAHSIRSSFEDGFLLPYQQLLDSEQLQGEDLREFIALAPSDHFEQFSYVSELVDDDGAIGALTELARVVDLLPGVVDGPWDRVSAWIADRIGDTWKARGPYPGLGAALGGAGIERGALIAHKTVEAMADDEDPWAAIEDAMRLARGGQGPAAGLIGRTGSKLWGRVLADEERYQLLRLLSRFSMTTQQARRIFDRTEREESGHHLDDADLIRNPYRVFEIDRGLLDSISLSTIDRGLFPQEAKARAALGSDPLPDPVTEAIDERRVRAGCVEVLERAADDGDSLLDEPRLRKRLADLKLDPLCDPTTDAFELAIEEFGPVLGKADLAEGRGRGWELERIAKAGNLIAAEVRERLDAGPLDAEWKWRKRIDAAIGFEAPKGDDLEEAARSEKAAALRVLARSRIGVLVGPAGTGKTTMLEAFCTHPDIAGTGVLLLAPTGKARVQLAGRVGGKAQTLAQFLRRERWDRERGYRLAPEAPKKSSWRTVVVDEASMLTEEMLGALLDALARVDRLILCGDYRQLPPIGVGRPFADLVAHLKSVESDETGGGLATLEVGMRQYSRDGETQAIATRRDDLAVAKWFAAERDSDLGEEAFARVLNGQGDGTLEIESWEDEDELYEKLAKRLSSDPEINLTRGDFGALLRSLGADQVRNDRASFKHGAGGLGAERWQILSPVRARLGGIAGLNRFVKNGWRFGQTSKARAEWSLPSPMGAAEVLAYDKVMCVDNHDRDAWVVAKEKQRPGAVANGEIGMAVGWPRSDRGAPLGLWIEFSTQPGLRFTFWEKEMSRDRERTSEALEIAYALTIHKSQGSQFDASFVVIPNPCPLLTPELLYTALTRHRRRIVVFAQGDPAELRTLASRERSETARRLTRLFRAPDPFEVSEGRVLDGSYIHKTSKDELVLSKSEVIVAEALTSHGIDYEYEQPLRMGDGTWKKPDFTVVRAGNPPVYWEHLGMLDRAGYRADWDAKLHWYADHGILPWTEGGGPNGCLVWSEEGQSAAGIDAGEIRQRVAEVFGSAK
jgi:ATP-dependent exoDNAse (exonuclease V) alpha subunit